MKNITLFLAVFYISGISIGQDVSLFATEIDSLENLLQSSSNNDTIKVHRLNDLARIYFYDLQYKKAVTAARQAQQLALKLHYLKGEGMYLRTMSCTGMGDYYGTKARLYYLDKNEIEPANTIEDRLANPDFFKNAIVRLQEDLAFYQKRNDEEIKANILYALSIIAYYNQKHEEEISYINKAIISFEARNMQDAVGFLQVQKLYALQSIDNTGEIASTEIEVNKIINDLNDRRLAAFLTYQICMFYNTAMNGKKAISIEKLLKANNDLEINKDQQLQIKILTALGVSFGFLSMNNKAIEYYKKATALMEESGYHEMEISILFNLGFEYVAVKDFEAAGKNFLKAKVLVENTGDSNEIASYTMRYLDGMGQILMGQDKYTEALKIFHEANDAFKKFNFENNFYIDFYIANCYQKTGDLKKSILYGESSYTKAKFFDDERLLIKICILLSEDYERSGLIAKSYEYLKKYRTLISKKEEKDIGNLAASFEIQSIIEKNQLEKDKLEKDKLQTEKENQNQRWLLICIGGLLLSTFIVLSILFRNNKQKQKANIILEQQKQEIDSQRYTVEKAFTELKATQSQLIQSEKMASLGELTAGIAHEIQNPLNFVNNFSEVNGELIEELINERSKEKTERDDALEEELLNDIKANEQKINTHGKRADAIVKGMLQHSRSSSGKKEPTDINALCDEYLRLSYHGLRAKDKSFNATLETGFDQSIGNINIMPQDMGRVILNLINNAFYAVNEKKKKAGEDFQPTVSVSTKNVTDKVEIMVSDNGNGIPQEIVDKIFQPFFTTKPTGQGTGLGLSLSYDIVKAHGGELKVETEEGEGTMFTIYLPDKS